MKPKTVAEAQSEWWVWQRQHSAELGLTALIGSDESLLFDLARRSFEHGRRWQGQHIHELRVQRVNSLMKKIKERTDECGNISATFVVTKLAKLI